MCIKVGWWNNSILWCTVEKTSNCWIGCLLLQPYELYSHVPKRLVLKVHKNSAYVMKFLVYCNSLMSVNMFLLTHVLYCATVAVHGNHFILCKFPSSDTSSEVQCFCTVNPALSPNNQTEWNRLRNKGTPGCKTWAYIMKY